MLVGIRSDQVILTQRPQTLRHHAGQIGFPGGGHEPGDESDWHTAARETHEELGLSPGHLTPLGQLPPHITRTGFGVVPIVALVQGIASVQDLRPDAREVAEVFELPLAELLDPRNASLRTVRLESDRPEFFVIELGGRVVWGATAAILRSLYLALAE